MTITAKSQHIPESERVLESVSSFYGSSGPVGELIEDIDDDVRMVRDENGRFISRDGGAVIDRVADGMSRAAKTVQQTAKRTAVAAQDGARTTAQAVREHPGMTAAVLGGLATAAYAGVRIYKASKEPNGNFTDTPQTLRSAPKRKVALSSKTVSRKKH